MTVSGPRGQPWTFDCVTIGGCGKKDVRIMDSDEGTFCANCGGEVHRRGALTEMGLFRMASSSKPGGD